MDASKATVAQKQEIRLADYQPPAFFVDRINLKFEVYDTHVDVEAVSSMRRNTAEAALILDGGAYMELLSVSINGKRLSEDEYSLDSKSLTIKNVSDEFSLEVKTRIKPHENTRLEGLYASGGNLCTQCEAEGFRHITYYPDRPDVLAVYTVRIEAEKAKYPVLLSNGDSTDNGALDNGRHYACWHDPHPKPSYLFALVAGKLSTFSDNFITKSGRDVTLNIYVREHDLDKCDHAMQSLKRAMKWDEDVYGLEYDLSIYNIVAVSDFNMGAMENKGLNVFNTKYVLANEQTVTDIDFDNIEGVIGHEYFHNWTGNRVTCRDWFQLSLKEGLTVFRDQEFSSDMTSRAVKRIADVRMLRLGQFPEDAGPLAHPVRPESYIEINNFYTATVYNKGAEVIRMMQRLLGEQAFNTGVRTYLSDYDGQAVTCEDFVSTMERVGDVNLKQFRLWYSQAGTPTVSVKRQISGNTVKLEIEQHCNPTPGQESKNAFHIPFLVGWIDANGLEIKPKIISNGEWQNDGCLLNVTQNKQTLEFEKVPEGAVPSIHRGFSAPVRLITDIESHEYAHLVANDTDAYARWQAAQELYTAYILAQIDGDLTAVSFHEISDMFGHVLNQEDLDQAFAAELLTLPTEIYLGQQQEVLTPNELHHYREQLIKDIAQSHAATLRQRLDSLTNLTNGKSQEAKAARRLKAVLLSYLVMLEGDDAKHINDFVNRQYYTASNMTEKLSALTLISNSEVDERSIVLKHFYDEWQQDELVIDKWFSVQALSKRRDAITDIKNLMDHKAFTYNNPNRVRSLIAAFSMMNQVRFHAEDGSGYALLADVLKKLDRINPQTAAKMVTPLCRWERLDQNRKNLMIEQLNKLLRNDSLSNDLRELVVKSLP